MQLCNANIYLLSSRILTRIAATIITLIANTNFNRFLVRKTQFTRRLFIHVLMFYCTVFIYLCVSFEVVLVTYPTFACAVRSMFHLRFHVPHDVLLVRFIGYCYRVVSPQGAPCHHFLGGSNLRPTQSITSVSPQNNK